MTKTATEKASYMLLVVAKDGGIHFMKMHDVTFEEAEIEALSMAKRHKAGINWSVIKDGYLHGH